MIHPKLAGFGAGLALAISFVGTVPALGQKPAALPEHVIISQNVVPTIRVPSSVHLRALRNRRAGGIDLVTPCDVTIAPGTTPAGGYLPLSGFGIPALAGVGDDNVIDQTVQPFTFAGETYTKIGFSTNGYAIIGGVTAPQDNSLTNQNFPNVNKPNNVLAPFWTDLNPGSAGGMRIGVLTDGMDSWIVLDWEAVREFSTPNSNSFQIWIGVNGDTNPAEDISFAYGVIQGNGDGGFLTVGAENQFGTHGQNRYFNGSGTLPANGTELGVTTSSCLTTHAVNLSTRMRIQTGDSVGVGGFIVTGPAAKPVIIRAIGPSLSGVPNAISDTVLELHGPGGFVTITNDDWRHDQEAAIIATGIPPTNNLESAIVATLNPGAYTAIVSGFNNATGVGLVEVYDLDEPVRARLANLSTRAFVNVGDNIVIGGFFLANHGGADRLILRGIGPSLSGVPNRLSDPFLELRDGNGALVLANDDWQDDPSQAALVSAAGIAPTNNLESAIAATLAPGPYTGLLRGFNNATGIGLVEIYDLGP